MIRPLVAWGTVVAFLLFGEAWLEGALPALALAAFFGWLFGVILWCAFGVVARADVLAEILGEPLGTLVLTLSIVVIEVALIAAVMLGGHGVPTLARDTMFAVLMIVLNGVVGLALLLGGLRHGEQAYNLQGAVAYLALILPLSVVALVLPSFTEAEPPGSLTATQAGLFGLFTLALYGLFLGVQTGRYRGFFQEAGEGAAPAAEGPRPVGGVGRHVALLLVLVLPIVLLAEQLAKVIGQGIDGMGAPAALGGVLIALVVFGPEAMAALRAALDDRLQRAVNLCLGAAVSTIGLTVPAILAVGLLAGQTVVLGLEPTAMTLLVLTLALSLLTFSGPRTTLLEGAVHLLVFLVYLVLIFSP